MIQAFNLEHRQKQNRGEGNRERERQRGGKKMKRPTMAHQDLQGFVVLHERVQRGRKRVERREIEGGEGGREAAKWQKASLWICQFETGARRPYFEYVDLQRGFPSLPLSLSNPSHGRLRNSKGLNGSSVATADQRWRSDEFSRVPNPSQILIGPVQHTLIRFETGLGFKTKI